MFKGFLTSCTPVPRSCIAGAITNCHVAFITLPVHMSIPDCITPFIVASVTSHELLATTSPVKKWCV